MERFKFLSKDKISQLPKSPGVYAFSAQGGPTIGGKDNKGLLYIGKAGDIKIRVKNHFQPRSRTWTVPPKAEQNKRSFVQVSLRGQQPTHRDSLFLDKIKKVGYIKTDSEIEALLLEAKLIKKYQPKFNVIWRDDKNYFFVGTTKEDFPQIFLTHQPVSKLKIKRQPSGESASRPGKFKIDYVGPFVDGKALRQALKVLRKTFPYRSCKNLPKRPCLWYQLDRCPAPCLSKSNLSVQLSSWRIKIHPHTKQGQPRLAEKIGETSSRYGMRVKKGCQRNAKNLLKVLSGEKKQVLKDLKKEMRKASKEENFETAAKIRNQIFSLERILAHSKILVSLPRPWVESTPVVKWTEIEKTLKKILKTKHKISKIEAYDISNIQGQLATGSMVTFIKGHPDKNFYRKFRLKIAGKPNDIAMMKEVLKRRFLHSEWLYSDLVLIDGGKAQLNAAKSIIKLNNLKIPVLAIAKRKNELYVEGRKRPILLKKLPREIFNLILQLRDEAHRFAKSYHHKLRKIDLLPKS